MFQLKDVSVNIIFLEYVGALIRSTYMRPAQKISTSVIHINVQFVVKALEMLLSKSSPQRAS